MKKGGNRVKCCGTTDLTRSVPGTAKAASLAGARGLGKGNV